VRRVRTLDELADVLKQWDGAADAGDCALFVRWSKDAERDLGQPGSKDELTGVDLPGLSANPLAVEPWWQDRPLRTWVARRLYDYRHLAELRGPGTRPWVLAGREVGRGPDNEPLVHQCRLVAAVAPEVIDEAVRLVESIPAEHWGSLRRG
jgi:hypothetical protein